MATKLSYLKQNAVYALVVDLQVRLSVAFVAMEQPRLVSPGALCLRMRGVMGAQKMSRKHLAELTGISRPSLGKKLDAQVPFTYDEIRAVVDALGVSWVPFLSDDDDPRRYL